MKRIFSFLCVLCCASMMGWAVQYCDFPTGHLNNADFGDANGRILLTLVPTGNANEYQLSIKPNAANGNVKKLDYLYAIIGDGGTTTPYPIEAGTDETSVEDELSATFTYTGGVNTMTIQWSYPEWTGRWQCSLENLDLSALEACSGGGGDPTPDPDPDPDPDPVSYCDFPTGHEGNPNFGDANGRILLSLEPTGNANEYKMTIKPNYANGATKKLDYLYVIAGGNTPYPATSGTDDDGNAYDEMSVTFTNSNATTSFTIQWSNPDWGGRWQCALNDVPLTSLSACAGGGSDPEPTEIYDVNFALQSQGGVASAKSGNNAGLANNGNVGDRWWSETADMTDSEKNDQWWQVDLGQRRIFNTIQIVWEGAWGKSFDIQISNDGDAWTTVKEIRNQNISGPFPYEQTIDLDANKTARYVRFQGIERGTQWAYSFWEFRVLLPGVSVLTSIDLTAPAQIAEVGGAGVALTAQPKDQNGQNMGAEVSYEITPAAAGHMSGNTYIPDQVGSASIRAYNGEVYSSALTIAAYEGTNVALNKTDDEITVSGYDEENNLFPRFAVDDNEGSLWSARHGETGGERIYDAWINVDLGAYYDINLIAIRWEGACSRHYHVDFSADNSAWRTAYNAGWNAMATHWEYLIGTAEDATKVRYVRVWSTEAVSQYGVKIMALKVYATEWADSGDTEEPVMTSASLVSKTYNSAVIAVEATDNHEVARYHVVDGTNNIDANFVASDGKITVTGLSASTAYNFTITAKDIAGNESANNKVVAVTTNAYLTAPTAAATPPAWDASLVKAIYSPTYSADCNFANWGGCVAYTADTYGKKFVMGADCWGFGLDGYTLNCLSMEKLHADIWIADDASLRLVPIYGGTGLPTDDTHGKFVNLVGQQWNSIDLDLASDFAGLNLASIFQFKIDNANGLTIWVGNLYFYRETAIVDNQAPTNVSATVATAGFYSAQISVQASDNSGAVNFSVRNGVAELATASAASGVATTITVNSLTPGSAYNLNVVAYDDAGNEAAPVAVQATTKTLPASAPVDLNGKKVIPVFTDAVEGGKNNISSGGWGESTIVQWLNLTANDKVFYAQNFNWAGWHSWGADIDATDMLYLHVDIYSLGMTSVSITPISHDPTHEGSAAIALTPNAWTSADIALSTYDAANIEWNKIFQFKFANPVGGNEFMADNVYFWQYGAKSNVDKWATFAAPVDVKVLSGVTVYKAVHEVLGNEEVLRLTKIVSGVIPANTGALLQCETESATYAFTLATSDEADVAADEFEGNSLVGCAVKTDISDIAATHDIYALRHSDAYGFSGFFLYSGTIVNAGKAYLPIEKDPATPAPSRRLRFVYDTATDVENVQPAASGVQKVLKDGQLYILRDEVTYTIQGVRVE